MTCDLLDGGPLFLRLEHGVVQGQLGALFEGLGARPAVTRRLHVVVAVAHALGRAVGAHRRGRCVRAQVLKENVS